jgi:hypothetical protein
MTAQETKQDCVTRVELVDNWHSSWPRVLSAIENQGLRESLLIDRDGWLSTRQVLLAAFCEDDVAGHLSFNLAPVADERRHVRVTAELDSCGVLPGFPRVEVESLLRSAAVSRANELRCVQRIGF